MIGPESDKNGENNDVCHEASAIESYEYKRILHLLPTKNIIFIGPESKAFVTVGQNQLF